MVAGSHIALALFGAAAAILLIHRLGWTVLRLSLALASRLPPRVRTWSGWSRLHPFQARAAARFPRLYGLLAARLAPRRFTGLPLTLLAAAALYVAALAAGLVEDFLTEP